MSLSPFERQVIYQTLIIRHMGAVQEYARQRGSSLNELSVLICLRYNDSSREAFHGGCTQQEICLREPTMPKQTVSAIVKRLERNGYVTVGPSADDHRTNLILLTDKGQEYANHVLGGFVEAGQHAATQFDDEEFTTLLELTRRFDVEIEQALGVGRLGSAIDVPGVSSGAMPA